MSRLLRFSIGTIPQLIFSEKMTITKYDRRQKKACIITQLHASID